MVFFRNIEKITFNIVMPIIIIGFLIMIII